jgi:hypothetical protein
MDLIEELDDPSVPILRNPSASDVDGAGCPVWLAVLGASAHAHCARACGAGGSME